MTISPGNAKRTVEQAITDAQQAGLTDVLIIGWNDEGRLVTRSSHLTRAQAVFLIEIAKLDIIVVLKAIIALCFLSVMFAVGLVVMVMQAAVAQFGKLCERVLNYGS